MVPASAIRTPQLGNPYLTVPEHQPQSLVVDNSAPGIRLDVYLQTHFPSLSRGALQRLIKAEHLLVDGRPVKPTHVPRRGEVIQITWPEPRPCHAQPQNLPLDLLFEDEDLLVVNKSPGVAVHPSAGHEEHTLVNALLHHCAGSLSGIGGVARPGIVHRLDLETSGCLVVAKNDPAHLALAAQFARRSVRKVYLALVCGQVTPSSGQIRAAIARHPTHRKRMAVTSGVGREALTDYEVAEQFSLSALVRAQLHTGRTHQVRVHLHHIGHPLVGDAVYGKRANQRLIEATGLRAPRQMLHAWQLGFVHPRSQEALRFEAPLPGDFRDFLEAMRAL